MSEVLRAAYALTNLTELHARGVRVELMHPEEQDEKQMTRARMVAADLFNMNPREFRHKIELWMREAKAEEEGR